MRPSASAMQSSSARGVGGDAAEHGGGDAGGGVEHAARAVHHEGEGGERRRRRGRQEGTERALGRDPADGAVPERAQVERAGNRVPGEALGEPGGVGDGDGLGGVADGAEGVLAPAPHGRRPPARVPRREGVGPGLEGRLAGFEHGEAAWWKAGHGGGIAGSGGQPERRLRISRLHRPRLGGGECLGERGVGGALRLRGAPERRAGGGGAVGREAGGLRGERERQRGEEEDGAHQGWAGEWSSAHWAARWRLRTVPASSVSPGATGGR